MEKSYDDGDDLEYPPWNFSWIIDGVLAGMSCPSTPGNMRYLVKQGVRHLVTLSIERQPAIQSAPEIEWTLIPVEEFEAPSMSQIKKFIEVCQRCQLRNQPLGVHCRQGYGRTGVMAACFLVHFQELAPERAIINLRMRRPRSIETPEQERVVIKYHDCIRNVKGTL